MPVNFAIHDGSVVFRTAPTTAIGRYGTGPVAFEADRIAFLFGQRLVPRVVVLFGRMPQPLQYRGRHRRVEQRLPRRQPS